MNKYAKIENNVLTFYVAPIDIATNKVIVKTDEELLSEGYKPVASIRKAKPNIEGKTFHPRYEFSDEGSYILEKLVWVE